MSGFLADILASFKNPWETVGIVGQLVFTSRFVVQWLASEKARKSVIPIAFWYLSIIGSIIMLAYALSIRKPSIIMGYSFTSFIYIRNLWLIYGWGKKAPANA